MNVYIEGKDVIAKLRYNGEKFNLCEGSDVKTGNI